MSAPRSWDELAVELLLAGDRAGLARAAARARAELEGRVACPDCGDEGPHQDNGSALCCTACGAHFGDRR